MNIIIEEELQKLVDQAINDDEVPVAAIIVCNNTIIGRGYNKVEKNQNFMNHAEIIAITDAMNNKKNWRLDNCDMYVTLEPCSMCKEIIKKSRIKNIYYYAIQNNPSYEKEPNYIHIKNNYFSTVLTNFFKNIRKK